MSIALYMDEHVPRAVTPGLRLRGIDVITAQEDGAKSRSDRWILERAGELNRGMFSQDADHLRIACDLLLSGLNFSGLIYSHQLKATTGQLVHDLTLLAKVENLQDFVNRIEYLPL